MAITAGDITFSSSSIQAWAPDIWAPELIEAVQFYIVIAGLFDDAGQVVALPRGKDRGVGLVQAAFADDCLAGVDAGGPDLEQELPCSGDGPLYDP